MADILDPKAHLNKGMQEGMKELVGREYEELPVISLYEFLNTSLKNYTGIITSNGGGGRVRGLTLFRRDLTGIRS